MSTRFCRSLIRADAGGLCITVPHSWWAYRGLQAGDQVNVLCVGDELVVRVIEVPPDAYLADPVPETRQFLAHDGVCPVELRSAGAQTIVPPSSHPSGKVITWHTYAPATKVSGDELRSSVARLAASALLAKFWLAKGALACGCSGYGRDSRQEDAISVSDSIPFSSWR